uniref:phosphatidate phosphatase n=1 Tax=Nothobranchius furzeri TaxID=105023 RepID=A0A8C6KP68_NOTFU
MNYVGQLAGQVFVQVKELYRGLNPATLSGCIDVIVVRQPDDSLQCSPFHVRFGKMGVLRSREKVVDMEINGVPVDLHMKLGDNGEAFFVRETENGQEVIPSYLATSPILSDGAVLMSPPLLGKSPGPPVQTLGSMGSSGETKKRRKRRRKSRADSTRREESGDYSADEDMFSIDMSSDEGGEGEKNRWGERTCLSDLFLLNAADKRSRHLGADGVYLDDLTDLEPEVAALYFPKSDSGLAVRSVSDPGLHSSSQSPQSMSSGGDSGVDSYCDPMSDLPSIAVSLCGGLNDNKEITKGKLSCDTKLSKRRFMENPSIIDDPNLVVKVGSKYFNWSSAAPLVLAMQVFQKPLPKVHIHTHPHKYAHTKTHTCTHIYLHAHARTHINTTQKHLCMHTHTHMHPNIHKEESSSSDEDHLAAKQSSPIIQSEPGPPPGGVSYKKTLRLTSDQLLSLQLLDGPNDVVFSVTTQYQGTCRCQGTIYLWNWDDKIIISDIDGTITRSDTLGHILPTLGKDWTHQGIAHLYHKVSQNGYKFLYCSARAIGMADMTRGYLNWVNERGTMLPMGPVLLSPSSLFSALHREVIEKKPEKFKVECLTDIKHLFYPNTQPFYAAFGNRPTDVYSYKEVGVPLNRIFTVNPKGELVQEHAKTNISSYARLGEVVDHVFPLKARSSSSDFPCSDTFSHFTYWREQLPQHLKVGFKATTVIISYPTDSVKYLL